MTSSSSPSSPSEIPPGDRQKLEEQSDAEGFTSTGEGWSEMAKIIREIDKQKMEEHTTDIDTTLLFTGLFSAILTAFLLDSINELRPPSRNLEVRLLHQIVLQTHSYTTGASYFNTTETLAPLPTLEFQPPANAVRVNLLWFASLTLSLITASFSILVKQWLREYLAGDYTSPQALLRIRHFRNPAFINWGVFELVAVVALLQQIYLALFLVGLCLYTVDVHTDIGHTTLVLVIGWGLLILVAMLLPTFSPRCPYKTSLVIRGVACLRKGLAALLGRISVRGNQNRIQEQEVQPPEWSQSSRPHTSDKPGISCYERIRSYQKYLLDDEDHAVRTVRKDIVILRNVFSMQPDQHLLPFVWDALKPNIYLNPMQSADCIIGILCSHSRRPTSSPFPDLRRLPTSSIMPAMRMLATIFGDFMSQRKDSIVLGMAQDDDWPVPESESKRGSQEGILSRTVSRLSKAEEMARSNQAAEDSRLFRNMIRTMLATLNHPAPLEVNQSLSRLLRMITENPGEREALLKNFVFWMNTPLDRSETTENTPPAEYKRKTFWRLLTKLRPAFKTVLSDPRGFPMSEFVDGIMQEYFDSAPPVVSWTNFGLATVLNSETGQCLRRVDGQEQELSENKMLVETAEELVIESFMACCSSSANDASGKRGCLSVIKSLVNEFIEQQLGEQKAHDKDVNEQYSKPISTPVELLGVCLLLLKVLTKVAKENESQLTEISKQVQDSRIFDSAGNFLIYIRPWEHKFQEMAERCISLIDSLTTSGGPGQQLTSPPQETGVTAENSSLDCLRSSVSTNN